MINEKRSWIISLIHGFFLFAPKDKPDFICSPIVLIYVDQHGHLYVSDFLGRRFKVDLKTGNTEMVGITK
ncbi:hypothetical protein IGI39_004212 [Enterococcus sp. AZ135]|uniref:hypothetical protein n=1 Tax=unclassified Enterococcus TaxID=2608891 RepID=UPI003F2243CF